MFFDSNQVEDVNFEPIPVGLYTITCVAAEVGPTAKGDGSILKVEFSVEGQGEKKLFENFTMNNGNPKAVKIGQGQLKDLCVKMGRPQLRTEQDLIGGQVRCQIFHEEYNGNTYAKVKKYIKPMDQSGAPQQSAAPQQQQQFQQAPIQQQAQQQPGQSIPF